MEFIKEEWKPIAESKETPDGYWILTAKGLEWHPTMPKHHEEVLIQSFNHEDASKMEIPPLGTVKVAPSGFNFDLRCPRCFYMKHRIGINKPSAGFPGIFSKIDALQSDFFMGKDLRSIHPGLPAGVVTETQRQMVLKKPLEVNGVSFTINGRLDIIASLAPRVGFILDNKTASPEIHPPEGYAFQQNCYCLVSWLNDEIEVPNWGLAYWIPDAYKPCATDKPRHSMFGNIQIEIRKFDPELVYERLGVAAEILKPNSIPQAADDCHYCRYAQKVAELAA